ncbi:MAG: tRNA-splicing endonuclease subunit [Geoglossum umbratile]|nr:MAG: tRNA-splicing endonuclease subunit [Geoglossum umbratile]
MTHLMPVNPDQLADQPIPISFTGGRYLLFDVNAITCLRAQHHICGVLTGSIPHLPQQNVFLGIPVELMPEEARLLVEKGVAFVVDDVAWHRKGLRELRDEDEKAFLQALETRGWEATRAAEKRAVERSENALKKRSAKLATSAEANTPAAAEEEIENAAKTDSTDERLFTPSTPPSSSTFPRRTPTAPTEPHIITPTISYPPFPPPPQSTALLPPAPPSYPLFAHLHAQGYFLSPGLRFGCQYLAYPGDPLRFHSHFLTMGYGWDEEFGLLDLVAGGRLGTGVKKGFLIGGPRPSGEVKDGEERGLSDVKTFCIEWGGM